MPTTKKGYITSIKELLQKDVDISDTKNKGKTTLRRAILREVAKLPFAQAGDTGPGKIITVQVFGSARYSVGLRGPGAF